MVRPLWSTKINNFHFSNSLTLHKDKIVMSTWSRHGSTSLKFHLFRKSTKATFSTTKKDKYTAERIKPAVLITNFLVYSAFTSQPNYIGDSDMDLNSWRFMTYSSFLQPLTAVTLTSLSINHTLMQNWKLCKSNKFTSVSNTSVGQIHLYGNLIILVKFPGMEI